MNSSSASQSDLFANDGNSSPPTSREPTSPLTTDSPASSPDLNFPDFGTYSGAKAQTYRIANRLIAATVSDAEYKRLLDERQVLLDKVFSETISREETLRLQLVRWSLDRIEDARHGEDMDRLEDHIDRYEQFLHNLDDFKERLRLASVKHR